MNRLIYTGLIITLLSLSSGCGMIRTKIEESRLCKKVTPHIYCLNEAHEKSVQPVSILSLWERHLEIENPNTEEAKVDAWVSNNGIFLEIPELQKSNPLVENWFSLVQRGMLNSGFRYTGTCDAEIPIICHAQNKQE